MGTTCEVRTIVKDKEVKVTDIKVENVPRVGEVLRITRKELTLHDWETVQYDEWIITKICHDLLYPYKHAVLTEFQKIILCVQADAGTEDD